MSSVVIPAQPPFVLRARLLSVLADGDYLWLSDGVIEVDDAGRIRSVRAAADAPRTAETAIDLRPLVVMPGLVDTHVHTQFAYCSEDMDIARAKRLASFTRPVSGDTITDSPSRWLRR